MTNPNPTPATDNPLTPASVLRGAAAYLSRHGWIQDEFYTDLNTLTPAACVFGALALAATGQHLHCEDCIPVHPDLHAAVAFLVDHLTHLIDSGEVPVDLAEWNDDPHMTAELVIGHLHQAADAWDTTHPSPH